MARMGAGRNKPAPEPDLCREDSERGKATVGTPRGEKGDLLSLLISGRNSITLGDGRTRRSPSMRSASLGIPTVEEAGDQPAVFRWSLRSPKPATVSHESNAHD